MVPSRLRLRKKLGIDKAQCMSDGQEVEDRLVSRKWMMGERALSLKEPDRWIAEKERKEGLE